MLEAHGVRTHPFELPSELYILDSQGLGSYVNFDLGTRHLRLPMRFQVPFWRILVGGRLGQGALLGMLARPPLCK